MNTIIGCDDTDDDSLCQGALELLAEEVGRDTDIVALDNFQIVMRAKENELLKANEEIQMLRIKLTAETKKATRNRALIVQLSDALKKRGKGSISDNSYQESASTYSRTPVENSRQMEIQSVGLRHENISPTSEDASIADWKNDPFMGTLSMFDKPNELPCLSSFNSKLREQENSKKQRSVPTLSTPGEFGVYIAQKSNKEHQVTILCILCRQLL